MQKKRLWNKQKVKSIVFFSALISIIWHINVYDLILLASCKLVAVFTFFTLATGAICGKPMLGT